MPTEVIAGVDFGSSRVKVAAYDRHGGLIDLVSAPTPLRTSTAGDDFLVRPMLDLAATALAELARRGLLVRGVGLTSMGEVGTVLTDGDLAELSFPSWYDGRGAEVVALLDAHGGARELRDFTGRHARVASTVAKLGDLASREALPHGVFLGICGALAWQLTGVAWQEAGLATTSGVFNPASGEYRSDLWEVAGLTGIALPPVAGPGYASPAVTQFARDLGIDVGAPVVIAGHDHPVASVGAGIRPGEVGDSMGTGEALIAVMGRDLADAASHRVAALDRDEFLSFEVWPPSGELLAVWERMRPGLAMRTFIDKAGADRSTLDLDAPAPGMPRTFTDAHSLALEAGQVTDIAFDAPMWGELIDYYVLLANQGERSVRAATGADGVTVLTGGGLRSARWRAAKALLGPSPVSVSTVQETATRGCAALCGVAAGWWREAESMPGGARVPIPERSTVAMEEAAAALFD